MLSFDFRIYSVRCDFPPLPSFSCRLFDLRRNIVKFGSGGGWRPSPSEEKLLHVLAGFILPTSPSRRHISWLDRMRLVNVAVSYLLNLRDVHLYLSPLQEMRSHESAPTRCPLGTAAVVFISVVCRGRDYSLVSENRLRWRHSHPAGALYCEKPAVKRTGSRLLSLQLGKFISAAKSDRLGWMQRVLWNVFSTVSQYVSHLLFTGVWLCWPAMNQATFRATFQHLPAHTPRNATWRRATQRAMKQSAAYLFASSHSSSPAQFASNLVLLSGIISEQRDGSTCHRRAKYGAEMIRAWGCHGIAAWCVETSVGVMLPKK